MANQYRILGIAFSEKDGPLNEFVERIKAGEWGEDRDEMYPEIRILTLDGAMEVGNCNLLPEFSCTSVDEEAAALLNEGPPPGFTSPRGEDFKAAFIAESRGALPVAFFIRVIEEFYARGVRFYFKCFDLSDVEDDTLRAYSLFHSTSAGSENEISSHCSAVHYSLQPTRTYRVNLRRKATCIATLTLEAHSPEHALVMATAMDKVDTIEWEYLNALSDLEVYELYDVDEAAGPLNLADAEESPCK